MHSAIAGTATASSCMEPAVGAVSPRGYDSPRRRDRTKSGWSCKTAFSKESHANQLPHWSDYLWIAVEGSISHGPGKIRRPGNEPWQPVPIVGGEDTLHRRREPE